MTTWTNLSKEPPSRSLSQDTILTHYYSAEQVTELAKILNFFDHYVMEETGINEVAPAYDQFNETLAKQPGVAINVPLKQQQQALYQQLATPVWESIWKYYESNLTKVGNDGDVNVIRTELISFNTQGIFWQYSEAYGKNDKLICAYMETNNASGYLSPSTGRMYFMDGKNFPVDFSKASNRLIAAIRYLTFNDQIEKEESIKTNNE